MRYRFQSETPWEVDGIPWQEALSHREVLHHQRCWRPSSDRKNVLKRSRDRSEIISNGVSSSTHSCSLSTALFRRSPWTKQNRPWKRWSPGRLQVLMTRQLIYWTLVSAILKGARRFAPKCDDRPAHRSNYRPIRWFSHNMKVFERIVNGRVHDIVQLTYN